MTRDIIDSAITITDVELCAMWAPLSIICGSGWFLDETVKSKMLSFVPLMKKQSFWMISRFVRALILVNELGEDLSLDACQDIFLYSSKIGILPGFPAPNGGWPSCTAGWMAIAPYFRNAMQTDEMKAFMKRYGYQTKEIAEEELRKEELRRAKELEEMRVAEMRVAERKEAEAREAEEMYKLRAEEREATAHMETVAHDFEAGCMLTGPELTGGLVASGQGDDIMVDLSGIGADMANQNNEVRGLILSGAAAEESKCQGVVARNFTVVAEVEERVIKQEVEEAGGYSDSSSENSDAESSTVDSEDSSANEDDSDGDDLIPPSKQGFATSMTVNASNTMTAAEFKLGQESDALFKGRLEEVRELLRLAGVRRWMDTNLHLILLSGPVGISRWTLGLLKLVQKELKRAMVKIKEVDAHVMQAIVDIKKEREAALKADEIWEQAQKEMRSKMDSASDMRKEDLRVASESVVAIGGLFSGGQQSSSGKRRSVYVEDRKKKKSKGNNPFEGSLSSRSETL